MTKLVLIRHGMTKWNKQGRYCGHRDIDLSSQGRAQAKKLSKRLKAIEFDKIYCSDRKRALGTSRIIFKGKKIIKIKNLREVDFGAFEGLIHEKIMEKYGSVYKKWLRDCYGYSIPNAEPMSVFKKRVESALNKIVHSNPGKNVAVVCHGGVIGVFVGGIMKSRKFWRYVPSAASMTIVEYKKGQPSIKKFNDIAHLR